MILLTHFINLRLSPGALLVAGSLTWGCTATLGEEGTGNDPNGVSDASGEDGVSGFAPPAASLRRLSLSEYQNSISDILGVVPSGGEELEFDDSVGGFVSIGARRVAMSPASVESYETTSYEIAQQVFGDTETRSEVLNCEPAQADDACVQGFIRTYARRFYRRPVTEEERQRLTTVVRTLAEAADIWTGLSYALAAMLQSPHFLYRVELGEPQEQSPWLRYDGYERATRLSFLLTGSTPDDELLDAAESGALDTSDGVLSQIDRLLESPRLQETLFSFFIEQLRLSEIGTMTKDPALLDAGMPDVMREEVELLVRDWIWTQRRPISELFVSSQTFVNRELAEFYGLPAPPGEGFVPHDWGNDAPRVGLLGTAGLLALNAGYTETSPAKRGRYVVEHLLCGEIPEPPPGIEVTLEPVPEGVTMTMRERVALHLSETECATCHEAMDPVGLPLEHFDAVGKYRETDHGLEIDASGVLGEVTFDGLRGLAVALSEDPRVDACMVEQFYSFALGHQVAGTDRSAVSDLENAFAAASGDFSALVRALVQHDAFLFASEPTK